MFHPEEILEKRKEINEIFAHHADFVVQIFGTTDPSVDSEREADFDILINLDELKNEDIVVCGLKTSNTIQTIHANRRHDMVLDIMFKLQALLDCTINIVDECGLQTFYPMTYSKLRNI